MSTKAMIVSDLSFGDAGKGGVVDFLARENPGSTVVRFNGGGQAAHNVITPDGRHHTFAQFGSGTFVPGTRTHLSRFTLIDPFSMVEEAEHIQALGMGDPFTRLSIDELAFIITPFQRAANRIREKARGQANHGSCGMGIGETMADSIAFPELAVRAMDLIGGTEALEAKLAKIQEFKQHDLSRELDQLRGDAELNNEFRILADPRIPQVVAGMMQKIASRFVVVPGSELRLLSTQGPLIFEGAQGVLIDEWHGFHPYTTWSTATFHNALTLLAEIGYSAPVQKIGVLRAYYTRHGPGPFVTEDTMLSQLLLDEHNRFGRWQGDFRVGWFDLVMARYAQAVSGGADTLAITNLDRFDGVRDRRVAVAYDVPDVCLESNDARVHRSAPDRSDGYKRVLDISRKAVLEDLSYQERLTQLLSVARPVYKTASRENETYLSMLEEKVGVPVGLVSTGPTALQKKWRTMVASAA